MKKKPQVAIIMGSDSDFPIMQEAANVLKEFEVEYELKIVSAHRTPGFMAKYTSTVHKRGIKVIIAGAGGAAHLPGMSASFSPLPVIGVPIKTKSMDGLDSLLSIAQMPSGVPVATVAINNARNAGLLAVQILALCDKKLFKKVVEYKEKLANESMNKNKILAR